MYYGIRAKQISTFESILANLQQRIKMKNHSSNYRTIECSIPQGSVMSPLSLLSYVNDLLILKLHCLQMTLICTFIIKIFTERLQINVHTECNRVDSCMKFNRLSTKYIKTAYMILTTTRSSNCEFETCISDVKIQQTDNIKYLGVTINNKLSCKPQVSSLCFTFS